MMLGISTELFNLHVLCLGNEWWSWVRLVIKNIFVLNIAWWWFQNGRKKVLSLEILKFSCLTSHYLPQAFLLRHLIALNTLFLISHLLSLKFDDENLRKLHKLWETSIKLSLHIICYKLMFCRSMIIISSSIDIMTVLTLK
jgi:hypothetical protein